VKIKKEKGKRTAPRKSVEGLEIKNLTCLDPFAVLAKKAKLIDVSSSGLLLLIHRNDLVPKHLRQNLNLKELEGEHVIFNIREMDLEMDGNITRTRHIGRGIFEVAVDYTDQAPDYWRETLFQLMPSRGEFDEH